MTDIGRNRLDQIVVVSAIGTPAALKINAVWAIPYNQIEDFVDAMKAGLPLGTAGSNKNRFPYSFRHAGGSPVDMAVWAVRGLRGMVNASDSPWDSTGASLYAPATYEGSGVTFPVDISGLTTPTIGVDIDGLGTISVDITASGGNLAQIVQILNQDGNFNVQAYAYVDGVGANRKLVIESQSVGAASSVDIVIPASGDDANALVGLTNGDSVNGYAPVELFRFSGSFSNLIT